MSVSVGWKPERAVQAKIRGHTKIYSRWIENPKGQSRQELAIFKKKEKTKQKAWLLEGAHEKAL